MYHEFPETVRMLLKDVLNNHALKLILVFETAWASFCFVVVGSCSKEWYEIFLPWRQAEARGKKESDIDHAACTEFLGVDAH